MPKEHVSISFTYEPSFSWIMPGWSAFVRGGGTTQMGIGYTKNAAERRAKKLWLKWYRNTKGPITEEEVDWSGSNSGGFLPYG